MARARKETPGKEQLQVQEETVEDLENIEIFDEDIEAISEIELEITQKSFFSSPVTQLKERFASSHLGQLVLRKCDGLLKVLEDTAKWSLPHDNNKIKLRRPLPWIFFLTLIVSLRTFRAFLAVAFCLLGLRPISPECMVYYIQSKRRQLRAIRVGGLKAIESRKNDSPDGTAARTTAITTARITAESSKENTKFIKKLTTLLGSAICQPRQTCEVHTRRLFTQDVKDVENLAERSSKRPRDDEDDALHNLTVSEMLDKYADASSDNDSDYIPKEEENADDDDDEGSSTSHISTSSSEETAKENKFTESENDSTESQKAAEPENIKENGETQYEAKMQPLALNQFEIHTTTAESDNEQMHTPKEVPEVNRATDAEEQTSEIPTAALEVATESSAVITPITPKTALQQLAKEWKSTKFTPGHESAASQKPLSSTTTNAAGSFQDFHSIFHPAPIVKTPKDEAQTSTPTEADHSGSSSSKAVPSTAAGNPKKNGNNSAHNKYYNYCNGKSRTKSYR